MTAAPISQERLAEIRNNDSLAFDVSSVKSAILDLLTEIDRLRGLKPSTEAERWQDSVSDLRPPAPECAVTEGDRAVYESLIPHFEPKWIYGSPPPPRCDLGYIFAPDVDSVAQKIAAYRTKSVAEACGPLVRALEELSDAVDSITEARSGISVIGPLNIARTALAEYRRNTT